MKDKSHLKLSSCSANTSKHSQITFNRVLMGKRATPLHHCTLPHVRCLYIHSRCLLSSTICSLRQLLYALQRETSSCCTCIHPQSSFVRTLATWAIIYTKEVHRDLAHSWIYSTPPPPPLVWPWWATAGQGRPSGSGKATPGSEPELWPQAQSEMHWSTLPAAIFLPFLHAPLPLLRGSSLLSCLFLELADF